MSQLMGRVIVCGLLFNLTHTLDILKENFVNCHQILVVTFSAQYDNEL